jgi:subtilisin-like proprotein convertase family protein
MALIQSVRGVAVCMIGMLLTVTVGAVGASEYIFDSAEVPKVVNGYNANTGAFGNQAVSSTVTVNSSLVIGKVMVSLYLPSTYIPGLQISLTGPDGTKVYLAQWTWAGQETATGYYHLYGADTTKGYGYSSDYSQRVYFDDGAITAAGVAPQYAYGANATTNPKSYLEPGHYIPYRDRLANFAGKAAQGKWTLKIENSYWNMWFISNSSGVRGSLNAWSLHIVPQGSYVWSGAAGDGKWSTSGNWRGNVGPVSGEQLVTLTFPDVVDSSALSMVNNLSNVQIQSVQFGAAGYTLSAAAPNEGSTLCLARNATISATGVTTIGAGVAPIGKSASVAASVSLNGVAGFSVDSSSILHLSGGIVDYNQTNGDDPNNPAVALSAGWIAWLGEGTYSTPYTVVGCINKTGNGLLTIATAGTQTGGMEFNNGITRIGSPLSLGVGYGKLNGGTLEMAFSGAMTVGASGQLSALQICGWGYGNQGALMASNLAVASGFSGSTAAYSPTVAGKLTGGFVTGAGADDLGVHSSVAIGIGARPGSTLNFSPSSFVTTTAMGANGASVTLTNYNLPIRVFGGTGSVVNCTTALPLHVLASGSGLTCNLTAGIIADTASIGALDQALLQLGGAETVAGVEIGSGATIRSPNGTLTVTSGTITGAGDVGTKSSLITGTLSLGTSPTFVVSAGSYSAPAKENLCLGTTSESCILTGATSLVKNGNGNLALTNCDYAGSAGTTINGGGLIALSSNLGAVTVNEGGFLGGTVAVGAVTVNAGGGIDPGRPMIDSETATASTYLGTLTCSSVTFGTKSYLTVDLIPGGDTSAYRDQLNVTGAINLGSTCRLRPIWRSATAPTGNSFTIIDTTTGFNTYFFGLPESDAGITYVGGTDSLDCVLTVTGLVKFNAASYSFPEVIEPSGAVSVASLPLSTAGTGNVYATTLDGTALSRVDYDALVDAYSLAFSTVGVDPAVSISLIYNMTIRSSREFTVPLYSPTNGAALQYPFTATVTVTDVNSDQDEKTSKCGMASGFAALFLALCATMRVVALRRSRAA